MLISRSAAAIAITLIMDKPKAGRRWRLSIRRWLRSEQRKEKRLITVRSRLPTKESFRAIARNS